MIYHLARAEEASELATFIAPEVRRRLNEVFKVTGDDSPAHSGDDDGSTSDDVDDSKRYLL